ncbi:anaerobic ribonucleoside-triphosphate reductase activating protein [Candidatus Woesearchaeota archaeon]|nr:anaerobic ribonucleoside-triphosphate reductase activating protein [Candidatus Woesearchaeota archaeon]
MQAYYCLDYLERTGRSVKKNVFHVYFGGCNFRCPYCNTPDLLDFREEYLQDVKLLKQKIKEESNFVEAVLFTGGEPTLQRLALIELARFAKKLKLKVGLDTNGSKPLTIKSLLEKKLLDFISLDIKAPLLEDDFERVTKSKTFFAPTASILHDLNNTISLLKKHKLELEIRIPIVPSLMYRKEDVLSVVKIASDVGARLVLVQFSTKNPILNKKLIGVKPPGEKFLKTLRDLIHKKYPSLDVYLLPAEN